MAIYYIVLIGVLNQTGFAGGRVVVSLYALDLGASQFAVGVIVALYSLCPLLVSVAIGKFAETETEIRDAMLANPWVVDDHGASDTLVMEKGMLAKIGAEGVFVIGLASGHGVAVKVADGSMRPAGLAAIKMLLNNNLLDKKVYEELFAKLTVASLGGAEKLGQLEVAF